MTAPDPGPFFISMTEKLQFSELLADVTFLLPNKKVTKEVVRGEAFRANSILAPDPTPAASTTAH